MKQGSNEQKIVKNFEKIVDKSWTTDQHVLKKSLTSFEKFVNKLWTSHEQVQKKLRISYEKIVKQDLVFSVKLQL